MSAPGPEEPVSDGKAILMSLAGGILGGPPSEFLRLARSFRAALNARDHTEEYHIDLVILAVWLMRRALQQLLANGGILTDDIIRALRHARAQYLAAYQHLSKLRKRTDFQLDEPRLYKQAACKLALEEAAKDWFTPDPNWRELIDVPGRIDEFGIQCPKLKGTDIEAWEVMRCVRDGLSYQTMFIMWRDLTVPGLRAVLGCEAEVGCMINTVESEDDIIQSHSTHPGDTEARKGRHDPPGSPID